MQELNVVCSVETLANVLICTTSLKKQKWDPLEAMLFCVLHFSKPPKYTKSHEMSRLLSSALNPTTKTPMDQNTLSAPACGVCALFSSISSKSELGVMQQWRQISFSTVSWTTYIISNKERISAWIKSGQDRSMFGLRFVLLSRSKNF